MGSVIRWLQVLGINSVPAAGFFLGGWSPATALALYWGETLVGSLFVAVRIAAHRRLTGKRGHSRPQLGVQVRSGSGRGGKPVVFGTFLGEFLSASMVFSVAHGFFLALLLGFVVQQPLELETLTRGALAVAAFQLLGLVWDLVGIRDRPFAWIREIAGVALGRTVLIHLSILGGMALLAWTGQPTSFFGVFIVLKALVDLAGLWRARRRQPTASTSVLRSPRLARWMNRVEPAPGIPERTWEEYVARLEAEEAADEEEEGSRRGRKAPTAV